MPDPPTTDPSAGVAGLPGIPDPDEPDLVAGDDGLWVLSRSALLRRGTCCGLGCRNCPYVGTALEHPGRARAVRLRQPVPDGRLDERLALRDGRTLAWAEFGDPSGAVVVVCHGTPSSRLGSAVLHESAGRAGLRLIVPDRPGMGRSTFQPRRTILDWPADVHALLGHLGVDRFRVLGYSGGGPFALACGVRLAPRIDRLAVVSGCAPVGGVGDLLDTGLLDLWLTVTARWAAPLADVSLWLMGLVARRLPAFAARAWEADLLPAERRLARGGAAIDPAVRLAFFVESMALGPRGARHDYRLIAGPWGFLPEEVEVPTVLWHGDADRIVPLHDAAELQIRLPRSDLRVVPGAGHLLLQANADEIFAALAEP